MSIESPSAIIIGSGISGLTTAYKLQNSGCSVRVFESGERVGGAMNTHSQNGWLAEYGPNTILETSTQIKTLITKLGLDGEKLYPNSVSSNRFIVKNGKLLPLPISPLAFFSSSLFSTQSKFNIIREPFIPKWQNDYEESLSEFVLRRLGKNFLDYAVNPFVAGVFAGDPDRLSVKHALSKLYKLEQNYGSLIKGQIKKAKLPADPDDISKNRAKMFSFKNGLKVLPETLASKLKTPIEFNTRVEQVQKLNEGWEITYNQQNEIKTQKADNLIYAGTGHQLADCKIISDKDVDLSFGNEIEYPSVAVLTLGFHKNQIQHTLNGFGLLVPEVENLQILGALFTSSLFPYRAPEDHVTITVFIGGVRQGELALEVEEKRLDIALNDLTMLLGISGSPAFIFHKKWTKAIPQYNVGYGDIKSKFQRLEKDNPGLYFTGNYREGISVADTMLQAIQTADNIINTNNN